MVIAEENKQMIIRVEDIEEYINEHEYLAWFRMNANFYNAEELVIDSMNERYEKETGSKVPDNWRYKK